MGLFKKIFKPVRKVLDKVIPNEIKPFLPYAAAAVPFLAPTSGIFGTMAGRAALSGGANLLSQLAQEGTTEDDLNLLSTGIAALSGALTAPGTTNVGPAGETISSSPSAAEFFKTKASGMDTGILKSGVDLLGTGAQKVQDMGAILRTDPFSKAGLKAATLPLATGTGDAMYAETVRLNKQQIVDDALAGLEEGFSNADASEAIRLAMLGYGFSEDEISETISSAGYKDGGRVALSFGGIGEAVKKIENKEIKETMELAQDMDVPIMDLTEEFEIIFKRKPSSLDELKQFYKDFYEYKGPGDNVKIKDEIKEKVVMKAKEGGLMNLGGKEMDLRGGGFVPIGKKERADDVPARLSKNEFVMTADAVRAAGGGSVNEGAKRMYNLMDNLEARV